MNASFQINSTLDSCKGVRSCFRSMTNTIASSRIATAVMISVPMVVMVITLFVVSSTPNYSDSSLYYYRYLLTAPIYVVSALTLISGCIGLLALKAEMQNILGAVAFVYAGIGYWAVINMLILFLVGWSYLKAAAMFQILLWVAIPTFLWLFVSSVMDRHRILVSDAIAAAAVSASVSTIVEV